MRHLDREFYESALIGLKTQRDKLNEQIERVERELKIPEGKPRRYTISPEGRARIAAAQKARWRQQKKKAA